MKYLVASVVAVFSLVLVVLIISRLITNRFKGKSLRAKHRNLMLVTCAAAVAILGATALLVITSAPAVRAPVVTFVILTVVGFTIFIESGIYYPAVLTIAMFVGVFEIGVVVKILISRGGHK